VARSRECSRYRLRVDQTTSGTGGRPGRPVETRRVPVGGISVYAQAEPSDAPVAVLPAGIELTVAGRRGPWVHIVTGDGIEGWVGGSELAGIAVGASAATPTVAPSTDEIATVEPTPVTVVEKQAATVRLGTAPVVGAIGGIIAIFGTALPWVQGLTTPSSEDNAFSLSAHVLTGWDEVSKGGLELGWLVLILAGLGTVVSLISGGGIVRRVLGLAIVLICIVYVLQAQDFLTGAAEGLGTGKNVWDLVDYGVVVSFAGGLVMVSAPSR
jgi:Bacterial SH3 domain